MSGSPGTGKTTLAIQLSQKLGLFHVERDKLKYGIEFMLRSAPTEREQTVIPTYFKLIQTLLELNVSCIADGTHFAGLTEQDIADFKNHAHVLNVHCNAEQSVQRAKARDIEIRKTTPDWLAKFTPDYEAVLPRTSKPLDHGYKLLEVDCNNGYSPSLDTIVAWVYQQIN